MPCRRRQRCAVVRACVPAASACACTCIFLWNRIRSTWTRTRTRHGVCAHKTSAVLVIHPGKHMVQAVSSAGADTAGANQAARRSESVRLIRRRPKMRHQPTVCNHVNACMPGIAFIHTYPQNSAAMQGPTPPNLPKNAAEAKNFASCKPSCT